LEKSWLAKKKGDGYESNNYTSGFVDRHSGSAGPFSPAKAQKKNELLAVSNK
jgi:hypothetical protein